MIAGIIEILSENSDFVSVVGMNAAATKPKVFWVLCPPEEKTPYVILRRAGLSPNNNKDAPSTLDTRTFEAYVYGNTLEEVENIEQIMRACLENKNWNTATVYFDRILIADQSDGYDKEAQKIFSRNQYTAIVKRPPGS